MTTATVDSVAVTVCELDELPVGMGRPFRVGGKLIAVFHSRAGNVYAVDGVCPHKAGPMADGMMVGEQIVCPLHAFRYDGTTGACDQPNVCAIGSYPVAVEAGAVRVTLPLA